MKMKKNVAAVMLTTGVLAVLGFGGTALADGGPDDTGRQAVAAATVSPSPEGTSDDSLSFDDSPGAGDAPTSEASPSPDEPSSDEPSSDEPSPDEPSPDDSLSPSPGAVPSSEDSDGSGSSPSPSPSRGTAGSTAAISSGEAKAIAIRAAGGGRVESIEREREHGRLVWGVDVIVKGVEHDIDVDAVTSEVTRHRTDDDRSRGRGGDDDRGRSDDD
ncbi:PepSY domain-containing protein [Actinoplanes sp. NPDC023801]|uniref:PepSY domain-containing protein n=1 Tax=Actinoplanes sp. NPDC023801 TaxID=3154595 RepID=UPI0033D4ED8D